MSNILLQDWDTPFGVPPFSKIDDGAFESAVDAALDAARTAIDQIADATDTPTFENVVEALELADDRLSQVLGIFYTLTGTDTNDARNALMRSFAPKLSAYGSEIAMNANLFARVEALWEARDGLDLSDEQTRVLMLTRRSFLRAGAKLEGDDRTRLADIKARLASLGTDFTQNLLKDEANWSLVLSEEEAEGLPEFLLDAAKAAQAEKGTDGPTITLSRSLIVGPMAARRTIEGSPPKH